MDIIANFEKILTKIIAEDWNLVTEDKQDERITILHDIRTRIENQTKTNKEIKEEPEISTYKLSPIEETPEEYITRKLKGMHLELVTDIAKQLKIKPEKGKHKLSKTHIINTIAENPKLHKKALRLRKEIKDNEYSEGN